MTHRTNFNENYLGPATENKWIEITNTSRKPSAPPYRRG
ncbi:MAG: Fic family protein [Bacteroidia bacterium]